MVFITHTQWTIILISTIRTYIAVQCNKSKVITVEEGDNVKLGNSRHHGHHVTWYQPPCDGIWNVLCNRTSQGEEMFFTNKSISFMCEQKSNMLNLRGLTPGGSGQYCKTIYNTRNGKKEIYQECYNVTIISHIKSTTQKMTTRQETSSHRTSNVTPSTSIFRGKTANNKRDRYDDLAPALELVGFLLFITIIVLFCLRTELFEGM
ncbi:Ja27 [Japanese cytomegalovirus]|nr:Ja27 [Japanese cytomegalovirus]